MCDYVKHLTNLIPSYVGMFAAPVSFETHTHARHFLVCFYAFEFSLRRYYLLVVHVALILLDMGLLYLEKSSDNISLMHYQFTKNRFMDIM